MTPLKRKRLAKNWSAFRLAEEADTLEMRIYSFERRRFRPRRDEAARIAAVLGTDAARLFPEGWGEGGK